MSDKLLRILEIIMTIIIALLCLVVIFTGIAIWLTSHPFIIKFIVTALSILVDAFSLYMWLLSKEV